MREREYEYWSDTIRKELEEQKLDTIMTSIGHGYTESESIISNTLEELNALPKDSGFQARCFLSCSLLEVIEREVICLPLIVSGFNTSKEVQKSLDTFKLMISRSVDSPRFVYDLFGQLDKGIISAAEDSAKKEVGVLGKHKHFGAEASVWKYREKVTSFRNYIVHGREFAVKGEAAYVQSFLSMWRISVINPVLNKYHFFLNEKLYLEQTT